MDMSTAILSLSEKGELQNIQNKWLNTRECSPQSTSDSEQLQLKSFWGLYLICGGVCFLALLLYFCSISRKFKRHIRQQSVPSTGSSSRSLRFQKFFSFIDMKEEEPRSIRKRKHLEMNDNKE